MWQEGYNQFYLCLNMLKLFLLADVFELVKEARCSLASMMRNTRNAVVAPYYVRFSMTKTYLMIPCCREEGSSECENWRTDEMQLSPADLHGQ